MRAGPADCRRGSAKFDVYAVSEVFSAALASLRCPLASYLQAWLLPSLAPLSFFLGVLWMLRLAE